MILEESPGTGYIYVIVFIYCCVLYIFHVSDINIVIEINKVVRQI